MPEPKPEPDQPDPPGPSLTTYLDLWNLLLILAGITLVLVLVHR